MSQRNPMNDRYTTDSKKGQSRKSAAKAKPKAKAASSVHVQRLEKTKQEKKAIQKAERKKDTQLEREAYTVPTPEYKRLRRIWFVMLGVGVVLLAAALIIQYAFSERTTLSFVLIGLAYAMVIGAFIFDKVKINKLRKAYRQELADKKSKEARSQQKAQKAEQVAKKEEEPQANESPIQVAKPGLMGKLFGKTKPAEDASAETATDSTVKDSKVKEKA